MDGGEALRAIGSGLNNLNAAFLAQQANSERRWSSLDQKIDRHMGDLYNKLTEVCDKGGVEHATFQTQLHALELRMTAQESRATGRADIWKPALEVVKQRLGVILFVAYVAWQQLLAPALAQLAPEAPAPISINGRL